ncbi:hypothetical protein LUX39_03015 [Actinomadura madurae]|nr:hypothetical protein [Actinomadura madurae]MCQ0012945.1 hypothetical protein [Actinomadura madurae]
MTSDDTPKARARPVRADVRRNRARLLAAAREAFQRDGAGASLEGVARLAGRRHRHALPALPDPAGPAGGGARRRLRPARRGGARPPGLSRARRGADDLAADVHRGGHRVPGDGGVGDGGAARRGPGAVAVPPGDARGGRGAVRPRAAGPATRPPASPSPTC